MNRVTCICIHKALQGLGLCGVSAVFGSAEVIRDRGPRVCRNVNVSVSDTLITTIHSSDYSTDREMCVRVGMCTCGNMNYYYYM